MSAYILDPDKKSLGKSIVLQGTNPIVTIYDETQIILNPADGPVFEISNDGNIVVGGPNVNNFINLNGGICYNFKQIGGTDANYDLTSNDYMVEVISDLINTVTLPSAVGNAGCSYIIARGETTNRDLFLTTQINEDIDGSTTCQFRRAKMHIKVISNGDGNWYRI